MAISQSRLDMQHLKFIVIFVMVSLKRIQVIENKIVIENKAISELAKIHYAQLKQYLKTAAYRLSLLINFWKPILEFKRVIL